MLSGKSIIDGMRAKPRVGAYIDMGGIRFNSGLRHLFYLFYFLSLVIKAKNVTLGSVMLYLKNWPKDGQ